MRHQFPEQLSLGIMPIETFPINVLSRDGLPAILIGLQYTFKEEDIRDAIMSILSKKILAGKKITGRQGMSLWEIMVLGIVKLGQAIDFDALHDLANNHRELRGILGVSTSDYSSGHQYHFETIRGNVQLLDEQTLLSINLLIVKAAHQYICKRDDISCLNLSIKSDSFVVESDIRFPTDLRLLWDSYRKCLDTINSIKNLDYDLTGWRQHNKWYKKGRTAYRRASEIHRLKGANYRERLGESTQEYLLVSGEIEKKMQISKMEVSFYLSAKCASGEEPGKLEYLLAALCYYLEMLEKHRDLVKRRILLGEVIPHGEKVFSLFETHVEWNSKGKVNKKVELGHNTLVATDQYHFILYSEVYEHQVDKNRTIAIGKAIAEAFTGAAYKLSSISFDRGFYSALAEIKLNTLFEQVVLPKPGNKSKTQQLKETQGSFVIKKLQHSAVEANINQLEHHGLDKCRDKGIVGFKRYVAYGILSYNLHRLGRILMQAAA